MQINILYIGNKLSSIGKNSTYIEVLGSLLSSERYNVIYASKKKFMFLRLFDMILKLLNNRKTVKYVIIDTYSTYSFYYALIISQLCRIFHIKFIPILHGGNLPSRFAKNPKLCQSIFDNAHITVAPSGYLYNSFLKNGFKNIVLIPNTIEIKNYDFKLRTNIQPKLLWVRAYDEIYNPEMAIKVLFELKKEYPHAKLCMIGPDNNNLLVNYKKLAKSLNLEVIFKEKLTKTEWTNLSKDYDIFLNTTHFDNTPVSVIEAMALGLPVVSTNVGGMPFLINDNTTGLLVNDDDVGQMVDAIIKLLENQTVALKIALNARKFTESFDWNIVKNQWNDLLN